MVRKSVSSDELEYVLLFKNYFSPPTFPCSRFIYQFISFYLNGLKFSLFLAIYYKKLQFGGK